MTKNNFSTEGKGKGLSYRSMEMYNSATHHHAPVMFDGTAIADKKEQSDVPEMEPNFMLDFISKLTGDQENPPVETDVMGMANLSLNKAGDALSYSLTVDGLDFGSLLGIEPLTPEEDDDVLFVHIHEGLRGENGPVVFDIISPDLQDDDLMVMFNNDGSTTLSGIWDFDDVQSFMEFAPEFQMAEPGQEIEYYFNVHSVRNPGGEVRGQIAVPEVEPDFISKLTGDQENPPVETDVMGMAKLNLNETGDALSYSLTVNGLDFGPLLGIEPFTPEEDDDVLFVHIHEGLRGENGPVVFDIISPDLQDDDLMVMFNNDGSTTLSGIWDFDDVQSFMEFAPEFQMAELGEELEYYFNVHSVRNPGGEVRGQIAVPEVEPDFISKLTGDQENPPVETDVMGMAKLNLNETGDALSYSLTVNGLDFGPLLGMEPLTPEEDDDVLFVHIHEGLRGENGPVVFDIISPDLQDDDLVVTVNDDGSTTLSGIWDFDDVQSFMEFAPEFQMAEPGQELEYYFNVHSVRNPGGEVRGQIIATGAEEDAAHVGIDDMDELCNPGESSYRDHTHRHNAGMERAGYPEMVAGSEYNALDTAQMSSSRQTLAAEPFMSNYLTGMQPSALEASYALA